MRHTAQVRPRFYRLFQQFHTSIAVPCGCPARELARILSSKPNLIVALVTREASRLTLLFFSFVGFFLAAFFNLRLEIEVF